MNAPSDVIDSLQLGAVPHPVRPGDPVPFFPDWESACQHLRDHLLTAPECHAWLLVAPDYGQIVDPDNADARWSYAEQAAASAGRAAQPLYDLYRSAVSQDAEDAALLGWHRSLGRMTVFLGLLKDALPHLSQFKYEDWAELRQRCGRDG